MSQSTNINQFVLDIGRWTSKVLPAEVVIFHKKVALELMNKLTLKNPVDTGLSRGNWQGDVQTNEEIVSVVRGPSEVVGELLQNLDRLEAYAVVFLFNNIHYITYLEEGHSGQAPDGFVALSILEMEEMFAS